MLSLGAVTVLALAAGQPGEPGPTASTVRLLYVREAGVEVCPAEPAVRAAVVGRLGYDPFQPDARSTLLARVSKSALGFTGSIELIDEAGLSRGKRELRTEGENCDEMARAMALSMSIAVDPERAALGAASPAPAPENAEVPTEPEPEPEPEAAPPAEPAAAAPLRPAPPARTMADEPVEPAPPAPTRLGVSVAGIGMAGIAPSFAYGGGLAIHGRRGAWSIGLGGRLLRSAAEPVDGATQLAVTLAAAELNGCWHHGFLEQCLAGLAGSSWVSARGITRPDTDTGAFGALGLRSGAGLSVSRTLELFARLEGLVVLAPVRPQVDGKDVWVAPSLAGSLVAGTRVDFW